MPDKIEKSREHYRGHGNRINSRGPAHKIGFRITLSRCANMSDNKARQNKKNIHRLDTARTQYAELATR